MQWVDGWHPLSCGVAVLVADNQPLIVCDLGRATLPTEDPVFIGDLNFLDVLTDELRECGWEVVLDDWLAVDHDLRTSVVLSFGEDVFHERPAHYADVAQALSVSLSDSLREVPGVGVLVDRHGATAVHEATDGTRTPLPLRYCGADIEVVINGDTWCMDDLVRRAWNDGLFPPATLDGGAR